MAKDKSLENLEPLATQMNTDALTLAHDAYNLDPQNEPQVTVRVVTPMSSSKGAVSTIVMPLNAADLYISGDLMASAHEEGVVGAEAVATHALIQFKAMATADAINNAERYYLAQGIPQANVLEGIRKFRIAREGEKATPQPGTVVAPRITPEPAFPQYDITGSAGRALRGLSVPFQGQRPPTEQTQMP
jgi:hypothetical protein